MDPVGDLRLGLSFGLSGYRLNGTATDPEKSIEAFPHQITIHGVVVRDGIS